MTPAVDADLLLRLRSATREAAGVPSYDPSSASTTAVDFPPTLRAAAAALDHSTPTHLRCERCRCRLSRGLQSSICLFCGTQPRREFPFTLAFTSTTAFRNLLSSLDVEGTEVVTLNVDSRDSNKGKDASGEEVVLSSLFEYELKWPRGENVESSGTRQAPSPNTQSLNLSGIDLDNFFDIKSTATSRVPSLDQEMSRKGATLSKEAHPSFDSRGTDDFDGLRSLKTEAISSNTMFDDVNSSLGDWGAKFQSAGSTSTSSMSITTDLFDDPSKVAGPIKTDVGFNNRLLQSDTMHVKPLVDDSSLISATDEWTQEGGWQSADVKVSSSADQENIGTSVSANTDMVHVDKTEPSTAAHKVDADPFDVWQDFTSSQVQGASDALSNTCPVNEGKGTSSKAADGNLIDVVDDMEFGDFLQSDSLSLTSVQGDLSSLNDQQLQVENVGSLNSAEAKARIPSNVGTNGTKIVDASLTDTSQPNFCSQSNVGSNGTKMVDSVLSQMHDLSFMLESNLCLPKTTSS